MPHLQGTPANIRINLRLPETTVIALHLRCWCYGSIFIQIFIEGSGGRMCFETECIMAVQRSSKVVDFGTNRKRVCDFVLVINGNLTPILPRFRGIAGYLLRRATPPLFHPNFWGCSFGLNCRYSGSSNYWCNYFRTNPTHTPTVHQRHRRTERQTDDLR